MSEHEERERRWMAYFLGELTPEECVQVEAELLNAPDEAGQYRAFIDAIKGWVHEPMPEQPMVIDDIVAAVTPQHPAAERPRRKVMRRILWLGAAAIALIAVTALSRAGFSVTVGGSTLAFGSNASSFHREAVVNELDALRQELAGLKVEIAESREQLALVNRQNAALASQFRVTTAQLLRNQQVETQTRYRDVQYLMQLAGLDRTSAEDTSNMASEDVPSREEN